MESDNSLRKVAEQAFRRKPSRIRAVTRFRSSRGASTFTSGNPGEEPTDQFLAAGGGQPHFQAAVTPLFEFLAGVPDALLDASGHFAREEQPDLPRLLRLGDAKARPEELTRIKSDVGIAAKKKTKKRCEMRPPKMEAAC